MKRITLLTLTICAICGVHAQTELPDWGVAYRLVPFDALYTKALLLDRHPVWIDLLDLEKTFDVTVLMTADLDSTGELAGNARIDNTDYSRVSRLASLSRGLDQFKQQYFANITVDNLTFSGRDNDSLPLEQRLDFHLQLSQSGTYWFLKPNLFLGLEENPFTLDHRFSDINFGYKQSFRIQGSVNLPDGFKVESLPGSIRMLLPDSSIVMERILQLDENVLSFRVSLKVNRTMFVASDYNAWLKVYYKKLYDALNEPVVLRKKA